MFHLSELRNHINNLTFNGMLTSFYTNNFSSTAVKCRNINKITMYIIEKYGTIVMLIAIM